MADSLQDQLRALGLAKDKPRKDRKRPQKPRKNRGQGSKPRPAPGSESGEMSLGKAWAEREREEKRTAEQKKARKIAEDRKRREINKALRTIVEPNRLNEKDAEVARNFMFRGRIRKVYLTPEQNRALAAGEMGLVYLAGGYHVLAAGHIEAVRGIAADHVVDLDSGGEADEGEFPVPDDIVW